MEPRGSWGEDEAQLVQRRGGSWGEDVAQLVQRRTGTPLRQVRFPGAARDSSPNVNFQCRLSYGARAAPVCNRLH